VRYRKWYTHVLDMVEQAQTTSFDPDYPYPWGKLEVRPGTICYGCQLWCGSVPCPTGSCGPVPCQSGQQTWEEMILDNAMRGMARTVYAPTEPQVARLETILEKSYYGLVSPISWSETGNFIFGKVGIFDVNGVPYDADETGTGSGTHPHPGFPYEPHGGEAFAYFFATLADAWDLTQDPIFLDKALLYLTGTSCGTGCISALRSALENPQLPPDPDPYTFWSPVGDDSKYDAWPQRGLLLGLMQQ